MQALRSIELSKKIHDKLLGDIAKKHDLTLNQIKILMFLKNNCEYAIAKDIVEGLGASKSHISMSLVDLEQKKYIVKTQDAKDKKKNHLELTKKSFPVIEQGMEVQQKVKNIMFEGINHEETEFLKFILNKMTENLEKYNKEV